MVKKKLRCVTRKSPLALWQANFVKSSLEALYPELEIVLIGVSTQGDRDQSQSLSKIGGKNLFVKELEWALLAGEADFAVHSLKDLPACLPEEFQIPAFCARANPFDVLVATRYSNLSALPKKPRIGTSSVRRQLQCQALFPEMTCVPLRGNVDTRLKKLVEGDLDGIILAHAGLMRLGLTESVIHEFAPEQMLPAIGQGALAVECLKGASELATYLSALNDEFTSACVRAERAMNAQLRGSCQVPLAAYARKHGDNILLSAQLWRKEGSVITAQAEVAVAQMYLDINVQAEALGLQVADGLFAQGAKAIMAQWNQE